MLPLQWDSTGAFTSQIQPLKLTDGSIDNLQAQRATDGQVYFTSWAADGTLTLWAPESMAWRTPLVIDTLTGTGATEPQIIWSGSQTSSFDKPLIFCGIAAHGIDPFGNPGVVWFQQFGSGASPDYVQSDDAGVDDVDGLVGIRPHAGNGVGPDIYSMSGSVMMRFIDFGQGATTYGDFGGIDEFYTFGDEANPAIIVRNGTDIEVMSTFEENGVPSGFGPVVTVEEEVGRLYGLTTTATNGTFFLVEDGTGFLSVLSQDQTLGIWTRIPVRQNAATAYDVTTWRTQLTVLDANGIPVANTPVTVTPDRDVLFWQTTGSQLVTHAAGWETSTDQYGRLTVALPTVELDAPSLVVTITDKDGVTTYDFDVAPDGDVHAYLAGKGSLTGKPAFTGAALQSATDASGQPLAPNLDAATANAAASAVSSCIQAGKGTIDTTQTAAFSIDFSQGTPTYAESATSTAFDHLLPSNPTGGFFGDLMKDLHAIEHAIRKAVTKVTTVVTKYAGEAIGWVINLALDVGQVVQFAVNGLRSAITAIHGILSAIGAAVEKAIEWIRMLVDDLIGDTVSMAGVLDDLVRNSLVGGLQTAATQLKGLGDGYFTGLSDQVTSALADAGTQSAGSTAGSLTGAPPDPDAVAPPTGSPPVLGDSGFDGSGFLHDVTHNWLFEKIQHEFDTLFGDDADGFWDDTDGLMAQLMTDLGDIETLAEDLGVAVWDAVKAVATPSGARGMAVQKLLDAIGTLVADALRLADDAVKTLADLLNALAGFLGDLLDQPILELPLLTEVLSKLGHPVDLSTGRIVFMMVSFPTVLVQRIVGGGPLPVPPLSGDITVPTTGGLLEGDGYHDDTYEHWAELQLYLHGSVRFLHAFVDILSDFKVHSDTGTNLKPYRMTALVDSVLSLTLLTVTWPGAARTDGTAARPFATVPTAYWGPDGLAFVHWVVSAIGPLLGTALAALRIGNSNQVPAAPTGAIQWTKPYLWWLPCVSLLAFGATMGLGIHLSVQKHAAGKLGEADFIIEVVTTVLELIPRMFAPFAAQWINDTTYELPFAIKLGLDITQVFSGAGYYVQAARA
ncbi:hypothetical protein ET445_08270 [Agromyces protaetiae]|uniref:Uncharacterized protein n=1 Tax=Agromyces protaetiae TaxID=2509455 RepID=A0A4P6FAU5_9MICO|nr:hypothetical protein [Agromyces protaetiae]QAY73340.1 hypothetical protein ET445_08270 [Agromyces protaetiae]